MRAAAGAFRSSGSDYSPMPIPVLKHTDFRTCRNFLPAAICRPKYRGRTEICTSGRKFLVPGPHGPRARGPRHAATQTIPSNHTISVEERNFPGASSNLCGRMGAIRQHQTNRLGWRARLRTILPALASDQARWRWWCCNDRFLNVTICKSIG